MSQAPRTVPFVQSIFHPSDFSKASELAFDHALAIALIRKSRLVIMHARRGDIVDWAEFPPVRKTLERWRVLPPGSPRSAVFEKLAIDVVKVSTKGDAVSASINHINRQKPSLVVLSTRGRRGLPLWLKPSVAQAIFHRSKAMTLFVPSGCRSMVSADGVIRLRRILLPIDHQPDSQEALMRAVRAAKEFREEAVEIVLLHANGGDLPRLPRPANPACTWKELRCLGEPVKAILEAAQEADLIIMATEGRHGVFDALRGSVTERIVRAAPCPVLAVPAA